MFFGLAKDFVGISSRRFTDTAQGVTMACGCGIVVGGVIFIVHATVPTRLVQQTTDELLLPMRRFHVCC